MVFTSLPFLFFFPIVTALYFALPHRFRWAHLLLASCVFYMALIPVYLLILLFTILIDYAAGIWIENATGRRRRLFLIASIIANVGVLVAFKYFNFFNANLRAVAQLIHWNYPVLALSVFLPVGLSFHTFQSMSYTIEVYRGRQRAERHLGIYALYVMFYPQLVAGPIERPQNLLPQFRQPHAFDHDRVVAGLRRMLWGFFKKMVVADRIAVIVDVVYAHPRGYAAHSLLLATYLFAYQIYCDFSGYTDIALGAAQVMGFRLMENFDRPYAAASVAEFWRRWHISLSTWFRDYVYIPLGGSRVPLPRWCFNLMVVFLISGLWHGADWTFVIWGALHGGYLVAAILTAGARRSTGRRIAVDRHPVLTRAASIFFTFNLVCLTWVFFRAASLSDAAAIIGTLASPAAWSLRHWNAMIPPFSDSALQLPAVLILVVELVQLAQAARGNRPVAELLQDRPFWLRWSADYGLIFTILLFGVLGSRTFIYFQF